MVNTVWKSVSLPASWCGGMLLWLCLSSTPTAAYRAFQAADPAESNSGFPPMQLALLPMGMPLPAGGVAISFVQPLQLGDDRHEHDREQEEYNNVNNAEVDSYTGGEGGHQEYNQGEGGQQDYYQTDTGTGTASGQNEQYYVQNNEATDDTTYDNSATNTSTDGSASKQQWKNARTKVKTFFSNHSRRDLSQQQQDSSTTIDGGATAGSILSMGTCAVLSVMVAGMGILTVRSVRRTQGAQYGSGRKAEQEYAFDQANIPPSSGYIYNTFDNMEERPKYLVPWKGSDLDKFDV